MKKLLSIMLIAVMLTGAFSVAAAADEGGEKVKVAVLVRLQDMYGAWLKTAFEANKDFENLDVTVMDTQDDTAVWMSLMENCINEGYDYIVTQGRQGDLSIQIKAAIDAGIGVIGMNYYEDWMLDIYPQVMCDDVGLGEIIAKDAAERLAEGAKVCILNGPAGLSVSDQRREGFQKGLIDARADVEILDEQDGGFVKDTSMKKTEDWLQLYDKIDAYICASDSEAVGVIEAYHSTGTSLDGVLIYGIDGLTDACKAILDGEMTASALQDASKYAQYCLQLVVDDVEGKIDIVNGKFEPLTFFAPVLLDESNAQAQYDFYESAGMVK